MLWINFCDEIILVNLEKRTDRLLKVAEQFDEYEIPFKRFSAIENDRGAEGLRDSMRAIFEDAIKRELKNVLVFEDDCEIVEGKEIFHDTMNKVVQQLPENYHLCFLGCQLTVVPNYFHASNVICGQKMFSTHAVLYSLQGMKEIISHGFDFPIDNFYVDKIEPMGNSYCTYPMLCSQRPGYSDICKSEINWKPFMDGRFYQRVNEMRSR